MLGDATFAAIEQHIENCPLCKPILDRLAHELPAVPLILPGPERAPSIPGFAIQHEVGRGAMGVVYLAIEEGLDRLVALKVLPAAVGRDESPGPRRRWLREARAISSVRHPNIVPLYDHGQADGWFYLVLEYVPGGTLKRRLAEPLPPRVAAGLVETIARAVQCIHGKGLLHLDLKPSNILLDGEDDAPWDRVVPRVSDFGLALSDRDDEAGPSETSLAGPRGTPSYMAPEQANASWGQIGPATDIHALGAILYELLTGRPPFQGSSTQQTLDQVRSREPMPPRRLIAKIPRDLETIALKCLEKPPSRRYASAGEMADDLRRWLDGRPIAARPASALEKACRWCCRRPAVAALAGMLVLTLLVGFLMLSTLLRRSEWQRLRSEASYHGASRSLDQLLETLTKDDRMFRYKNFINNQINAAMEDARSQAIELSGRVSARHRRSPAAGPDRFQARTGRDDRGKTRRVPVAVGRIARALGGVSRPRSRRGSGPTSDDRGLIMDPGQPTRFAERAPVSTLVCANDRNIGTIEDSPESLCRRTLSDQRGAARACD